MKRTNIRFALLLLALAAVAGCAKPAGPVFPPVEPAIVWPPPPEAARIRYVGQLATSADLKPAVSFGQRFHEALFGRKPVHSMLTPIAVTTDGQDRLFVADSNGQLVHLFDLKTRRYHQLRPQGSRKQPAPPFGQPVGIAWEPPGHHRHGRVLVSDSAAGRIVLFDGRGQHLGSMGEGVLKRPVGIAVEKGGGRIFVADTAAHQVLVFSPDGSLIQRLGERGEGPGQFNYPTHLAFDSAGNLYVSDSLNFRVQKFGPDLAPIRSIGRQGDMPGYFSQPKGVSTDSEDHLYAVDAQFEAVQIFDADGRLLLSFGQEGRGPGQFWLPAGIHIDGRDRIWIADSYNRRVQVFEFLPEGP